MTEAHTSPGSTSAPALADADSRSSQPFHATVDPHEALQEARDRLTRQLQVVLRLKQMPLSSGASVYRVKASMATLAHAVGISKHRAQVTCTKIIAASYTNGAFRTGLAEQKTIGVNTDRINRLNNLVTSLKGRTVLAKDIACSLDEVEKTKPLYGQSLNAAASGLACAAFFFLSSGGWVECSTVAVVTFFSQVMHQQMLHRRVNHFGVWMACGGLAAFIYILLVAPARQFLGLEPTHQAGFISALLFLVPGFSLVTDIINLVRHDFRDEITRLTYVFMLLVLAGVATWTVSTLFRWSVTPKYSYILPLWLLCILRALTSSVMAFGFAMLFNSPPKIAAIATMIDALISTARLLLVSETHAQVPAAVGLAALATGLLATFAASKTRFSQVALSIPAVVIMIPGIPLYRSFIYLNNGQMTKALTALFTVVFTIVGIGVGFAVAHMLTDRNWLQEASMAGIPALRPLKQFLPARALGKSGRVGTTIVP